jgi:hypothetical protein
MKTKKILWCQDPDTGNLKSVQLALIQNITDGNKALLYLNEHGTTHTGDTCTSANLNISDKVKKMEVYYDSEKIT